jgi:hypothetical protein
MSTKPASSTARILLGLLVAAVIATAATVAIVAVVRIDASGEGGSGLSSRFKYDNEKHQRIDPQWMHYRQTAEYVTGPRDVRAVAVGTDDEIFVAADDGVLVLSKEGTQLRRIGLTCQPTCVAVGGAGHAHPGRLYVGLGDRVEVFASDGNPVASWPSLGQRAVLTSIAVAEEDVFVADAGNKVVSRYDADGNLLGKIGAPDADRGVRGFVIPSAYFDVAVTHDRLLRVVNPGAQRIEAFTFDGELMDEWGEGGSAIDGFYGCCNPANMCVLPDDRFVTVEKGLPRIKVYALDGTFESVVAGPEQLTPTRTKAEETRSDHRMKVFDVAADSRGRVLVLDPHRRTVRVFEKKDEG